MDKMFYQKVFVVSDHAYVQTYTEKKETNKNMELTTLMEKCNANYGFSWGPVHFIYQGNEKPIQIAGEYNMQIKDINLLKDRLLNTKTGLTEHTLERFFQGMVETAVQKVINRSGITEDEIDTYKSQILESAAKNLNADSKDEVIFNVLSIKTV